MRRCLCGLLCLLLCLSLIPAAAAAGEYRVSLPEEREIAAGRTVTIPVAIEGGAGTYHTVDMRITYDPSVLEYASSSLPKDQVVLKSGEIRVRIYGKGHNTGTVAFTLTFQPVKIAVTEVKIVSAKVDNSEHALYTDAPEAEITNAVTKIQIAGYSVTLPTGFKGAATAYPGKDYTFSKPAGSTKYTVTAKVNGKTVPCKEDGNGNYTVAGKDITGPLVITAVKVSGGNNGGHFTPTGDGTDNGSETGKASYEQIWVTPYVELDNATVFLIAVAGSPKKGQTYAYNGDAMFFTKKYAAKNAVFGKNVYIYLQLLEPGESLRVSDVSERITVIKDMSPEIDLDPDMNGSGAVNGEDAKIAYDIYNAMYWSFDDLPMAWFLAADLNLDGAVNVQDVNVIISGKTA